ncbi:DNA double-strand break repair Rad50 ATPase-like, partial [Trifolium medium]|nr:DNA double-strand break repair Rad50 ATPase-like [Trifolium medium]
ELEERVKNHLTTISELGEEKSKLAHEKRKVEIFYKLLCTKFRDLQGRVSKLEDDSKLWMNVDASDGGNSEGEPRADHMAADFEDNGGNNEEEPWMNVDVSDGENSEGEPRADPDTDFEDNGEEDDIVEAAPLPRSEDAPHSLGVAASTQPQNIGGNDAQGASS